MTTFWALAFVFIPAIVVITILAGIWALLSSDRDR